MHTSAWLHFQHLGIYFLAGSEVYAAGKLVTACPGRQRKAHLHAVFLLLVEAYNFHRPQLPSGCCNRSSLPSGAATTCNAAKPVTPIARLQCRCCRLHKQQLKLVDIPPRDFLTCVRLLCPYSFKRALNSLKNLREWGTARCPFSHQSVITLPAVVI